MGRIQNIEYIAFREKIVSATSVLCVCVCSGSLCKTHFLLRAMIVQVWKAQVSFSDFQVLFHGIQWGLRHLKGDWGGRSWIQRAPGTSPLLAKVVPCVSGSCVGFLCGISCLKKKKKRFYWKKSVEEPLIYYIGFVLYWVLIHSCVTSYVKQGEAVCPVLWSCHRISCSVGQCDHCCP